jgi:cytoskeletal protein CcmA (bactofilin family)
MKTRRNLLLFAAIVIGLLALGLAARQWLAGQELAFESGVNLASEYRLSDTFEGDLVVMAGSIVLEAGSRVTGSASLIGDTIVVGGVVDGDLSTLGDETLIEKDSHVQGSATLIGDIVSISGRVDGNLDVSGDNLTLEQDALVGGLITPCVDTFTGGGRDSLTVAECKTSQQFAPFETLIGLRNRTLALDGMQLAAPGNALLILVLSSLTMVGFSTLAVTMFPRQISHIEEAIRSRPRSLVGAGFATFLLIIGLCAALIILLALLPPLGLVLLPLYFVFGLILLALVIAGMVTLSLVLGEWLVARFWRATAPPLVTVIVGSLTLSAALTLIVLLPFGFLIGSAALALVSSAGVGAALFTRLGTRPLRRSYFIQG